MKPIKTLLAVAIISTMAMGCTRGVTSTSVDGFPSNLNTWIDSVKQQSPQNEREPLPLLLEQEIFSYADHMSVKINPNPTSALQRAGQLLEVPTNPSLTLSSDEVQSTSIGFDSFDNSLQDQNNESLEEFLSHEYVDMPQVDLLVSSPPPTSGLLRSPFDLPISAKDPEVISASTVRPDPNRPKQPLEAYPLDSLSMVGTFGSGNQVEALIMAPDKVVHRVAVGQYLGQKDGRVTEVSLGGVGLAELVEDGAGGWVEQSTSLVLID